MISIEILRIQNDIKILIGKEVYPTNFHCRILILK